MIEIGLTAFAVLSALVRTTVFLWGIVAPDPAPRVAAAPSGPVAEWQSGRDAVRDQRVNVPTLQQAVVSIHVGGGAGSGVCVDRRGYILTVRHVIASGECQVSFGGRERVPAHVIWAARGGDDGAVLLKCDGDDWPAVGVAEAVPLSGAAITIAGFHQANYVALSGTAAGSSPIPGHLDAAGHRYRMFRLGIIKGMSGGPIVDDAGRVISLNCRCDFDNCVAYGLSLPAVRQATDRIPPAADAAASTRPQVEYWWMQNCGSCQRFAGDFPAGSPASAELTRLYHIVSREYVPGKNDEQAAMRGISALPAFVFVETGAVVTGYSDPQTLMAELAQAAAQQPAQPPFPGQDAAPEKAAATPLPPLPRAPVNPLPASESPDSPAASAASGDAPKTGVIGWLELMLAGAVNSALSVALSWYFSWRAQQGFLKGRVIDRYVRKAVKGLEARASQSAVGAAVVNQARKQYTRNVSG